MSLNNVNLGSPYTSSFSSQYSGYHDYSTAAPIITTHAKDYTNSIKRPIPPTVIPQNQIFKLQAAKDLDYLNQRKIVALLESGEERFENEGLKILTLLSYSDDIEFPLKPKARLLPTLLLLLQSTSKLPMPPSFTPLLNINIMNESKNGMIEDLSQFNLRHIENLTKRKQILKILYNLSFESQNKPIISAEKKLILKLIDFAVEDEPQKSEYLIDLVGVFSNIAKYAVFPFDNANFKLLLHLMIDLLVEENWQLTRFILSFFQKLSERSENEQIFLTIENEFFNSIIALICLPQSFQNNNKNEYFIDSKLFEEQIEVYRTLQEKSLSILHNLSTFQGLISQRSCQQIGCVEVLISLLDLPDFPDISRRSAITLLNFSSEFANHSFLLPHIEKLLLLAWNYENPSSSILLKLISKLTESQSSPLKPSSAPERNQE